MRHKRADELLLKDVIVERAIEKKKLYYYEVKAVQPAACSLTKTHVTIADKHGGVRHWCYDSAQEVDVSEDTTEQAVSEKAA